MTQTYTVTGMTCGGCQASVTKHLSSLDQVEHVVVNLEKEEALITSKSPIETSLLQEVLPEKFALFKKQHSPSLRRLQKKKPNSNSFSLYS